MTEKERKRTENAQKEIDTLPPKKARGSLSLNSIKNIRKSLAKTIRLYNAGGIDAAKYKNLIYGLATLAHLCKTEFEMSVEERIDNIERALKDKGKL